MKLQIAPRESEIATMRKQVEEMNLELEQYHKSNQALNLMIEELKLKLEGLRRELLGQKGRATMNERVMDKYKMQLQDIYMLRDDIEQFKVSFLHLFRVFVLDDMTTVAGAARKAVSSNGEDSQVSRIEGVGREGY